MCQCCLSFSCFLVFVSVLRTCSPLPSALRKTGLFGFPKQTVCSACWGGGVGAKGWKVPFLKVQKKKRVKCFRGLQTSVLFRFRFSVAFHLEVQCDVVAFEVVRFLVESVASNDVH